MPNWNPLTNAVGGAGATAPVTYYNSPPTNFGEYQFIKLTEIIENFIATYIGEGKILQNTLKGDVNFHAHRALQELSYDTLKSCKSQEIEVCPSLKMPLPHDYVNYVKITSVDASGIEHIIYPTRHTSHPFAIEQDHACSYQFNDGIVHQTTCEGGEETTCDGEEVNSWVYWFDTYSSSTNWPAYPIIAGSDTYDGSVAIIDIDEAMGIITTVINGYCVCLMTAPNMECGNCGTCVTSESTQGGVGISRNICWDGDDIKDWLENYTFPTCGPFVSLDDCTLSSNAWTNYSSSGGSSTTIDSSTTTNPSIDADNYYQNTGERYGLQPEHAQVNGSFFIDCMRGNIHFGSNFSGKTIILHYISDHHGTEDEEIVHKFAEEAMYKWIAYGCLSARADVPDYIVNRFKREKFAETRKAKIRLSNIKLEEITQIMRNKSKWIDH